MKKQWQALTLKIDALSVRERGILFVLCTFGLLMMGFTLFIEPQLKQQKNLKALHQTNQTQVRLLQEEIAQRSSALKIDPDAEIKLKINDAKARLQLMDQDLLTLKKNLVQAEKMDGLLQDILKRNKGLQLSSMKSLPVVNLMDIPLNQTAASNSPTVLVGSPVANAPVNQDERSIYKHEVELELQGNYLDMLAYIKALEAMPERVYWSHSSLTVLEYPKASLTLRLFTLSLEKKWLNL